MRLLRTSLLAAAVAGAAFAGVLVPTDARASVSIAVAYDALVKDADSVDVVTPVEQKSVWEEGRIYTYTRVKVEQGIAGEMATGNEGWVRTMGGVVGKVGQLVDGEPVFATGKPSLIFLRKLKAGGTWEVSARAQGQFPVVTEEVNRVKIRKVTRSGAVGVLYPPKALVQPVESVAGPPVAGPPVAGPPGGVTPGGVTPQQAGAKTNANESTTTTANATAANVRLAGEVLHDRPLDDVTKELAASWKRLHAVPGAPASGDTRK